MLKKKREKKKRQVLIDGLLTKYVTKKASPTGINTNSQTSNLIFTTSFIIYKIKGYMETTPMSKITRNLFGQYDFSVLLNKCNVESAFNYTELTNPSLKNLNHTINYNDLKNSKNLGQRNPSEELIFN